MSTETKATETKGVETIATRPETVVTPTATEVDYADILAKKDAELADIRAQKENYRKAYLKNAGAIPPEDDDKSSEDREEMVRRITREELLATKEAQAIAEKDSAIKAMAARNKELEVALRNRGQITTNSGQGSNQEKPEVKTDNYLSNEQLAYFRSKNWDDKKIEQFKVNARKTDQSPK